MDKIEKYVKIVHADHDAQLELIAELEKQLLASEEKATKIYKDLIRVMRMEIFDILEGFLNQRYNHNRNLYEFTKGEYNKLRTKMLEVFN